MSQADNFVRAQNESGDQASTNHQSLTVSQINRSSFNHGKTKKVDPYNLDFAQLRKDYVDETTMKIPFVKSSFVHYSKCPRSMEINDKEYRDLVITMEVVMAPNQLKYTQLEDPKIVRKQAIQEKKDALIAAKKEKARAEKAAAKAEQHAERDAQREEKNRAKNLRIAAKQAAKEARLLRSQSGSEPGSEAEATEEEDSEPEETEEEDSEPEETDEEVEGSDIEMSDLDLDLDYDDEDDSEPDSGSPSDDDSGSGSYGSYGDSCGDEDREYTGDMFSKGENRKFMAGTFKSQGQHNSALETNDYCCITIWSTGGIHMRYKRLKDTILRIPPLKTDMKFRVSHDAKRIYYIGLDSGIKKLVVVYLKDLSHKFIELGKHANEIETFEDSSLYRNYICYALKKRQEEKINKKLWYREVKDFYVLDYKSGEVVWEIPRSEKVFFNGKEASKITMKEFVDRKKKLRQDDESETDFESADEEAGREEYQPPLDLKKDDDEDVHDEDSDKDFEDLHSGIMVIRTNEEEVTIEKEDKKEDAEGETEDKKAEDKKAEEADKADGAEDQKAKKVTRKFIRAYFPVWKQKDFSKRKFYETYIDLKGVAQTSQQPATQLVTDDGHEKKNKRPAQRIEENEILYATDNDCQILCIIIKGLKGEQHSVRMFNPEKREYIQETTRAGNSDLEFNMNSHVRPYSQIFIVMTDSNNHVSAKQIEFDPTGDNGDTAKVPPVPFTRAERGYAKDCWMTPKNPDEDPEEQKEFYIFNICKSSSDEYLNSDCVIPTLVEKKDDDGDLPASFKIEVNTSQIKAQEIEMSYPCLVSNIGLSRVMIQSMTCPDQVASFKLDDLNMDFICFAEYQSLTDIGFTDKRDATAISNVPFSETGDKIAFVTRKNDGESEHGDMYLNVLSIDSYSKPMKFELFTTNYEASMDEGMSDDSIKNCIALCVTSARGLDVAFVAQYNDRIVYDCVTSTKQLPIRFPMPQNKKEADLWNETDNDFKKGEQCVFEDLAVSKGGQVVRQRMIMDDAGAVYFMMNYNGTIKVMRTDPAVEMGDAAFIKSVFTLRSKFIYFMLYHQGLFYIMDDTKKIRLLKPNVETNMWKQQNTFELRSVDYGNFIHSDFDEYSISDGVLHSNDHMYYLLDSASKDNETYAKSQIMLDNHIHVSGPCYAKSSGMIWYTQSYNITEQDYMKEEKEDFFDMNNPVHTNFKGFSIVMQPLADLSFIDLLPQRGENNKNFVSFLDAEHIMVNYSGRYLIFDLKGVFKGAVKFNSSQEGFHSDQLKLVCVSDSGKFFIFEGPHFLTKQQILDQKAKKKAKKEKAKENKKKLKEGGIGGVMALVENAAGKKMNQISEQDAQAKKDKKQGKNASGGAKAPMFYIFKLDTRTSVTHGLEWRFMPYSTKLFPFIEDFKMFNTSQRVNYQGQLSQCTVDGQKTVGESRDLLIEVKNYKSEDQNADVASVVKRGLLGKILEVNPASEEKYRLTFCATARDEKKKVLAGKIAKEQKAISYNIGSKDNLVRLMRREGQMDRAWVFDNYIVAKSGSEIKYIRRKESMLGYETSSINFEITPGAEVWVENVFSTGVEDLIQLFIIDDANFRVFIITWNLQSNREHSLFQSSYEPEVFPENLIMKGSSYLKQQDFNYFLDNGSIISLDSNLPVQFFDMENEADTMPKGPLPGLVENMKRISQDRSRYLDMTKPGRVHHFISYIDLLYWERYQTIPNKHEITKGVLSSFSPIARFPKGISVFHYFATNVKVLATVQDAMVNASQLGNDDARVDQLPLVFLHSNPFLNKPGKKTTPIHIALDKQSPIAFETMFSTLASQHRVCVTQQLLDVLESLINSKSQSVLDFFNDSFLITDQYAGLRALEWEDPNAEEMIVATSCAYLTDEYMQFLVSNKDKVQEAEKENQTNESLVTLESTDSSEKDDDAPMKYSGAVEPRSHGADDSNLKQVEAKILDFNWVFIGDNNARFIKILSSTENDEIFAQSQVRVYIDFMWKGYYDAIFQQLFLPFMAYFISFIAFSAQFSHYEDDELSWAFIAKIICIVVMGKTYITFVILEIIQIKNIGYTYFFDVWNMVDLTSLGLNAFYVSSEITNGVDHATLQVIASFCIFLMWFKLFYWMRLFKPFSAFIRMITEILKDIQVFLVMLIISLAAFANVIYVLNLNRVGDLADVPIYSDLVGFAPADAMIHAYLTGLGEFGMDNYSEGDATATWIMFFAATVIVQLVFMNLLIAIMGESFARVTAIMQQSTYKELCSIMEDHIWLQKIDEIFASKRHILWLTPDTSTSGGSPMERQLTQLKEQSATRSDVLESKILRAIGELDESVTSIKAEIESLNEKATAQDDDSDEF